MFSIQQTRYWHFIVWAGQIGILQLAKDSNKPAIWALGMASVSLISLIAWASSVWRAKVIADTPTSAIASAAQGYVELKGIASPKPEYIVVGKSGLPCVWFRSVSFRRHKDRWEEIDRTVSDSIFEINDDSDEPCMVDPEYAEIVTSNRRTWYNGDYKHVEEQLFPGQPLYLLGEFSTLTADTGMRELNTSVSLLLAEWKKNQPLLLERFDADRDGKIDFEEWEAARQEAHRQISSQNRHLEHQPGIHIISRPKNGRPFLISNLPEHKLRRRTLLWSWLHLAIFFAALCGAFWIGMEHGVFREWGQDASGEKTAARSSPE